MAGNYARALTPRPERCFSSNCRRVNSMRLKSAAGFSQLIGRADLKKKAPGGEAGASNKANVTVNTAQTPSNRASRRWLVWFNAQRSPRRKRIDFRVCQAVTTARLVGHTLLV